MIVVGNTVPSNHTSGRIFDTFGISPTVMYRNSKVIQITEDDNFPCALKYQRTEYAKKIRKLYELGEIKERRCNMREYTYRTDGLCNTITTVKKDNYVAVKADDLIRNHITKE